MFFEPTPEDLQPMEKEMLDAMLEVWEQEMIDAKASEPSILEQAEAA